MTPLTEYLLYFVLALFFMGFLAFGNFYDIYMKYIDSAQEFMETYESPIILFYLSSVCYAIYHAWTNDQEYEA
ncbi:hypothetical protein HNY73_017927 [Argiope bruennichi]|uniref:Uncharacterized protein n=1 Tax=Argiope bruennichi TaxID=94029 RepID=A0A8T0ECC2_ARGBR|nr:hypothetical protein HNY73_017927 [Argiope bruennichi]